MNNKNDQSVASPSAVASENEKWIKFKVWRKRKFNLIRIGFYCFLKVVVVIVITKRFSFVCVIDDKQTILTVLCPTRLIWCDCWWELLRRRLMSNNCSFSTIFQIINQVSNNQITKFNKLYLSAAAAIQDCQDCTSSLQNKISRLDCHLVNFLLTKR